MFRIRQDVQINAPRQAVWNALFDDASFRDWGAAFMAGSYISGEWVEGGTVRYLVDGENGKSNGMISRVQIFRPLEFASVLHIGIVSDGADEYDSDHAKVWTPAEESFRLVAGDGGCHLFIEAEIPEDSRQFFEQKWPVALQRIKAIAEQ